MGIPLCCMALHINILQPSCFPQRKNQVCCICCSFLLHLEKFYNSYQQSYTEKEFLDKRMFPRCSPFMSLRGDSDFVFRDEYPELECPLHLTGTDCCESYFGENGSFVMNRHNYTFVDMHTNLGYMNRMQEIRVTNNELQFPKRKTNNDFIWDKQFDENQRR